MSNLIPDQFIQWHFSALDSQKALCEFLRTSVAIPDDVFSNNGRTVSADDYARLLNLSILHGQDESFGVLKRAIPVGSFQMMCHSCISCTTLQQATPRALAFYALVNEQVQWRMEIDDHDCHIYFTFDDLAAEKSSYFVAFISVIIWRWLSWMIKKTIELTYIGFEFSTPDCFQHVEKIFNQKVTYNQTHNKLTFSRHYLKLPVKQNAKSLEVFLVDVPACLLSHYQQDACVTQQLKDYLRLQNNLQKVTLHDAASYFYCSEQSLIRRLRSEGTRFKAVLDEIRCQRALRLLTESEQSNQHIASTLGYSDISVFYRNVKRWSGKTPNQLRNMTK